MLSLLKNTYLLNNKQTELDIERLWRKYQGVLDKNNPTWEEMNEARAILYFIGYLYPEKIALESLERRIKLIKPKIILDDFLLIIDSQDKKALSKYKNNKKFNQLKEFYLIVKTIKNKVNKDGTYLDEAIFNKKYNKLKPKDYF
ncbi:hypothetical protein L6249_01735 [Candidatus Parcubacteria bacterium]|nr:hypothetical protein [Patescibacteria group bacterium]MCG2690772.1 hypothetical protein [Candidatus Parcubacteria bacterium]